VLESMENIAFEYSEAWGYTREKKND
jgi:hypothetical protein